MTPAEALAFVERHGIVLEAARHGAIVSLIDAVAAAPVRGNWWAHPQGRTMFALTRAVRAAPDVLVCRLVDGRISFVHQRLWPALARLAGRFPPERLARLHEVHSAHGTHRVETIAFPQWLPDELRAAAHRLRIEDAEAALAMLPEALRHAS